jgi:hypothetical protein
MGLGLLFALLGFALVKLGAATVVSAPTKAAKPAGAPA